MIYVVQAIGYLLTAMLFIYMAWLMHRAGLDGMMTGFMAFAVALMRWTVISLSRGGVWLSPDHWMRDVWVGTAQAWVMVLATLLAVADLAGWIATHDS